MGGFGSGGHNRKGRLTTAEVRSIDANAFRRAGVLRLGFRGGWQWSYADGTRAWIGLLMRDAACLVLVYRYRRGGAGARRGVGQPTPVVWRPCRLRGARPPFSCPPCGGGAGAGEHKAEI